MSIPEMILSALLFLAELILWFGAGRIPYLLLKDKSVILAWGAGIIVVVAVLFFWGMYLSPKADQRLKVVPRIIVISLMTIIVGLGLLKLNDKVLGWIMIIPVFLIQAFGQYIFNEM